MSGIHVTTKAPTTIANVLEALLSFNVFAALSSKQSGVCLLNLSSLSRCSIATILIRCACATLKIYEYIKIVAKSSAMQKIHKKISCLVSANE